MSGALKRTLVVVLLVVAISTPWALVQSLAWLNMLATYSRQANLKQAIQMTFDGKHPCRLCHLAQNVKREQREQHRTVCAEDKLQLGLPPQMVFLITPPPADPASIEQSTPVSRCDQPPSPPPRSV